MAEKFKGKAKFKRKIRPGREYDKYILPAKGVTISIKKNASVIDTVKHLQKMVRNNLPETSKLAPLLKGRTLKETCQNIWNFVYWHIQYREDKKFIEQLRRPARLWADKAGDCDCYTVFISSLLTNLSIPHIDRITKYIQENGLPGNWQHIYPIVPINGDLTIDYTAARRSEYIVIDCVPDYFDYEVPFYEKKDFNMELVELAGFKGLGDPYKEPGFKTDANIERSGTQQPNIISNRVLSDDTVIGIDDKGKAWKLAYIDTSMSISHWVEFIPGTTPLGKPKAAKQAAKAAKKEHKAEKKAEHKQAVAHKKEVKHEKKAVKKAENKAHPKGLKKLAGKVKAKVKATNAKIKKGIKKSLKKVGGALKKVAHLANKLNPGFALIRNGVLAAAKINMKKLGTRLKWAYLTPEQAQARGCNMEAYRAVVKEKDNIEKTLKHLGGEPKNFRKAILKGKGNKKDKNYVPLNGLGAYDNNALGAPGSYDHSALGQAGEYDPHSIGGYETLDGDDIEILGCTCSLNGLGEPVEAAAGVSLLAAAATVASWVGKLKKAGKNLLPSDPDAQGEFDADETPQEAQQSSSDLIEEAKTYSPSLNVSPDSVNQAVTAVENGANPDTFVSKATGGPTKMEDKPAEVEVEDDHSNLPDKKKIPSEDNDQAKLSKKEESEEDAPEEKPGMSTTAKVAIGVTVAAGLGAALYFGIKAADGHNKPVSGLPKKKKADPCKGYKKVAIIKI